MRSRDFVQETTNETQLISSIADRTVVALMEILRSNKPEKIGYNWRDLVASPRLQLQMFQGIALKNLNIPRSDDPVIKKLIDTVSIRVDFEEANPDQLHTASYVPGDSKTIIVRPNAIRLWANKQGISLQEAMHDAVAHEIQHAVDDLKSGGVALNDPNPRNAHNVTTDDDYQQYLKLPYEINARFAQSATQIARGIANGQIQNANLASSIKLIMSHNDLVDIFKDNPKAYQKLAKRLYLFFQAEMSSPKKIEPGTLLAKVKSWLTGRPHEVITELADSPYPFLITQHSGDKSTFGFDTDNESEYIIKIVPFTVGQAFQNNALDVSFALMQDGKYIDTATGQAGQDALRVFGTVVEAVKQTIAKRTEQGLNIEYIQFKAVSKEPKRVALYQRFAKSIGRYLPGWEFWRNWNDDGISTSIVKRTNENT